LIGLATWYNNLMRYFLARDAALKWLETPAVYHIQNDELYELDEASFAFFESCTSEKGCASRDSAFLDYSLEEGLISTERSPVPQPKLKKAPAPSLRYLELQITDACNLRCKHCYIEDSHNAELPLDRIRLVLKEFEDMQGLRLLITGGEPLLHSAFNDVNAMLPEFSFRKILFTNGLALPAQDLGGLNVHEIQLSIDGLEKAHDALRGQGTFTRTIDAATRALDAGFDVSISTMVHPENFEDFDGMERLFRSMKIKDWTVDVPCLTGRLKDNADFQVLPEEGGKYLGYGFGGGLHSSGAGFGCGLHLMSVLADGRAAKCTFYADRAVGSVDEGLRTCWQRVRPVPLASLTCDCSYLEACRGGCRFRAELLSGKNGKDLYRCALYGIE
jgi:radical SAM protein with 4Fe4S-binding SPASM domain